MRVFSSVRLVAPLVLAFGVIQHGHRLGLLCLHQLPSLELLLQILFHAYIAEVINDGFPYIIFSCPSYFPSLVSGVLLGKLLYIGVR